MGMLAMPAFWRIYYQERLRLDDDSGTVELRELSNDEATGDALAAIERWDAILDRVFGPRDAELRRALFPRIDPPETFDDADVAEAVRVAGDLARFDDSLRKMLLQQAAVRRRAPPNRVIRLSLPGDYVWQVELDPCPGIYHSLSHPSFEEALSLGSDDAHFRLPILRWEEFDCIGAHLSPEARPLLAATCWLAEGDDRERVAATLRRDWLDAAVLRPEQVDELIDRFLWPSELRWRPDPALGWVNDGNYSLRNPDDGDWREVNGFHRFARFLEVIGS